MSASVLPSESVVLCEGYYDRQFWAGFLMHFGCASLRPPPNDTLQDPFGVTVKRDFAYRSVSGGFIRVRPCHSKDNIGPAITVRLRQRITKPLQRLVVNADADTNADGSAPGGKLFGRQSIVDLVQRKIDPSMTEATDGGILIDGGTTVISLIQWQTNDPPAPHLPNQQTLERLACAALCAVFPERGAVVQNWLTSRPNAPEAGVKEFAFSHMAGWYADQGCDAFYRCLWENEHIVAEMKQRLIASGAWAIAEALAR